MPPSDQPAPLSIESDYDAGLRLFSKRQFREAMVAFKAVISDDPDHVEANVQIGRILLETFWGEASIQWFKHAAELQPDNATAWMGWAEAVALGGNSTDRRDYLKALKTSRIHRDQILQLQDRFGSRRKGSRPQTGGVPMRVVQQLIGILKSGAAAKAEAVATDVLRKAPKCAVAANIRGEGQARQEKFDAAFKSFQHAVKLDPQYTEAYSAMGQMLLNRDKSLEAIQAFRAAVVLSPDMVPALVGLGAALSRVGHIKASLKLLRRAQKLDAKDPVIAAELGHALARQTDPSAGIEAFELACALYKGKAQPIELRVALAEAYYRAGDDDRALEILEDVLEIAPDFAGAFLTKGTIHQSKGDFQAAKQCFGEAISSEPTMGEAYRRLMIGRRAARGDAIIEDMKMLFDRGDLAEKDRMNLGFALAKALDDVGDYDQVFSYLNTANAILSTYSAASGTIHVNDIKTLRDRYERTDFPSLPSASDSSVRPIFVTGMARSGTTLIEQIIAAHSSVMAGGELGYAPDFANEYFANGSDNENPEEILAAVAQLGHDYISAVEKRFSDVPCFTDKSIFTFQHIGALKRALPAARFIVVRRDPRDNLLSIYKNKFAEGTHGYANGLVTVAKFYDEFDKTIQFWRERVPNWFYEVSYDALVANPEEESRKLIDACGLEWEDQCLEFYKNKSTVKTLSLFQVRQPINTGSVKGWKRYEKDLQPMIEQLREDGHVSD